MIIDGQKFDVKETFDTAQTVPDCFVLGDSKIGGGHGEKKFYISTKERMREFYGNAGFNARCFVLRSDLLAYMQAMKQEYLNPSQTYRGKEKMSSLWLERVNRIQKLPEVIEFNIQDQTQIVGPRGYVNSSDDAYRLIREISLPNLTYISALRLADSKGSIIFYWKLFADFDAIGDLHSALVYTYGKKETETEKKEIIEKPNKRDEQLRYARIGQGLYREKLLEECPFCPITMINDERLLIASHIKPWAVSTDKERLDPKNGFMLSPLYDKLFDRGFITFTDDRCVHISNWLSPQNIRRIGITEGRFIQMLPIDDRRKDYLAFHRESVFKG
ncbi:MAG: HNH endonuclease [Muribaculaceae bacterium]|nr:HNH endonuclease [Muribaculaceae bacterium]